MSSGSSLRGDPGGVGMSHAGCFAGVAGSGGDNGTAALFLASVEPGSAFGSDLPGPGFGPALVTVFPCVWALGGSAGFSPA